MPNALPRRWSVASPSTGVVGVGDGAMIFGDARGVATVAVASDEADFVVVGGVGVSG